MAAGRFASVPGKSAASARTVLTNEEAAWPTEAVTELALL